MIKFILVLIMSGLHGYFSYCRKKLLHNNAFYSPKYLKYLNEAPTIIMVVIVIMVIVRPFNIYGPGQKTDFLVPLILDQLINGVEVSVKDLGPKRDYLFIADFIDALICLSRKEIKSGIYNLGSGVSYSVKEVIDAAQLILETGHKVFETEERRGNEVMNVVADIGAIAERCDWKPQWGIEAGLAACIDKVKTDLLLK